MSIFGAKLQGAELIRDDAEIEHYEQMRIVTTELQDEE